MSIIDQKEFEYRVGKLQLGPGDVLIVKVTGGQVTPPIAEQMKSAVRATIGDGPKIMLIDDSVDLSVLTKTEIEARAT